jgi:hypothetical protein
MLSLVHISSMLYTIQCPTAPALLLSYRRRPADALASSALLLRSRCMHTLLSRCAWDIVYRQSLLQIARCTADLITGNNQV